MIAHWKDHRALRTLVAVGYAAIAGLGLAACTGAAGPQSSACGEDRTLAIVTLAAEGDAELNTADLRDTVLREVFGSNGYATRSDGAACLDRPLLGDTFHVSRSFSIRLTEAERAQLQRHRLVDAVMHDEPAAPHSR